MTSYLTAPESHYFQIWGYKAREALKQEDTVWNKQVNFGSIRTGSKKT